MVVKRVKEHKTLLQYWLKFLEIIKGITILVSLLMCPTTLGYLIYYTFFSFDVSRALLGCAILFVMPYLNIKIQGVD